MSQVIFQSEIRGQAVEVMSGWDAPMGWFFLGIFDGDGKVLYSNLNDRDPAQLGRDTVAFRRVLTERGITPPEGFWALVEQREGNHVAHRHGAEGWEKSWG